MIKEIFGAIMMAQRHEQQQDNRFQHQKAPAKKAGYKSVLEENRHNESLQKLVAQGVRLEIRRFSDYLKIDTDSNVILILKKDEKHGVLFQ